jgi:hypothetical protein
VPTVAAEEPHGASRPPQQVRNADRKHSGPSVELSKLCMPAIGNFCVIYPK